VRRLTALGLVALALLNLGFEWEGRLARLRRELSSPSPARRREVIELLAHYPATEVREALLGALEDPDPSVRTAAAAAAGQVRLAEAAPVLMDWLDDPDADVRAAAARALGPIGDSRSIPSLVRILGDNQSDVRRAGVMALATLGGDEVIVPLLGRLDDVDARVRLEAAQRLGRLGDPRAAVPLVGRARDDAPEVRTAVYAALGELGDPRAVAALVQGLRDEAPDPRLAAIGGLGRLRSDEAVRPLAALLAAGHTDGRVPRAVVAALGQLPGAEAREALVTALADPRARSSAGEVLLERAQRSALRGDAEEGAGTIAALASALEDARDVAHANQIATILLDVAPHHPTATAAPALLRALGEGRGEAPPVLRALGATGAPEALLPLLERLSSDEPRIRTAALDALRHYFDRNPPDGRAADPLLTALAHVPAAEREPIVDLLGRLGAPRALPTLRTLLGHADPALRRAAIRAMGAIGDPEGAPALLPLLADRDARLRYEAAQALGAAADPSMLPAILEQLQAREPTDRHALLTTLTAALPRWSSASELPAPLAEQARATLLELAEGADETLAARALSAFVAWRDPGATDGLLSLLERAGPDRALTLVRALAELDTPEARAALRRELTGPSLSRATQAASVLGERGTAEDGALLLERAGALPWPGSAAATFALARLARRGALPLDQAHPGLCRLAQSHDPFVRANVAAAMAALAAPPCPDGPSPLDWLTPGRAAVVRAAAARWAHASASHLDATAVAQALATCAADPLTADVAATCARPELPPLGATADVIAYGPDGTRLWSRRWVALRLADGSVLVTQTDANGQLRLHDAPRGELRLEDPSATPLEP
jgi:HEAT repeat protein